MSDPRTDYERGYDIGFGRVYGDAHLFGFIQRRRFLASLGCRIGHYEHPEVEAETLIESKPSKQFLQGLMAGVKAGREQGENDGESLCCELSHA